MEIRLNISYRSLGSMEDTHRADAPSTGICKSPNRPRYGQKERRLDPIDTGFTNYYNTRPAPGGYGQEEGLANITGYQDPVYYDREGHVAVLESTSPGGASQGSRPTNPTGPPQAHTAVPEATVPNSPPHRGEVPERPSRRLRTKHTNVRHPKIAALDPIPDASTDKALRSPKIIIQPQQPLPSLDSDRNIHYTTPPPGYMPFDYHSAPG